MKNKKDYEMIKEKLEKEAEAFAEQHAFRVPYDGSNKFYDDVDFKASKEGYLAAAKPREKQIQIDAEQIRALQQQNGELTDKVRELEAQIEKMKCLNEEIIKALKESNDYEWLHAHNGQAKYMYLQTVIDIVNEKFEEIKEK